MTLNEAIKVCCCPGYLRVRSDHWASPLAYSRFFVTTGFNGQPTLGPWMHLFDRDTQERIGERTPQALLIIGNGVVDLNAPVTAYDGELDRADAAWTAKVSAD